MNDLQMLPRLLQTRLDQTLHGFPVVVLLGARQTGKTTLVRHLPSAGQRVFRTLDDLRVLDTALNEPEALLREGSSMAIDEVQRAPQLLHAIKRAVDEQRQPGRFLLTGSANLLLMHQVSETLAGRAVYLQLGPLTQSEKAGRADLSFWTRLMQAKSAADAADALALGSTHALPGWPSLVCEGGMDFPPSGGQLR